MRMMIACVVMALALPLVACTGDTDEPAPTPPPAEESTGTKAPEQTPPPAVKTDTAKPQVTNNPLFEK
jgi:hypothetical protein